MKTERLSAFALMHAYARTAIDGEAVAREFLRQDEQDAKLRIPIKLEIFSWAFSPVQFVITLNLSCFKLDRA